jgi:DMSO/TMAO reductase YedYZ molybdopterin-dependent catalytic subunit
MRIAMSKFLPLLLALAIAGASAHDRPAGPVTTSVAVEGAVEHKLNLGVEALTKDFSAIQFDKYRGVRLRDVLNKAVVQAPDRHDVKKMVIIATASDGYKVVFSWSELFNSPLGDNVLVLFEKDGAPLGNEEGRIALISGSDLHTGPRHVKWLRSLEIRKIVD